MTLKTETINFTCENNEDVCCGELMMILYDTNSLVCKSCNKIKKVDVVAQSNSQDDAKGKHGAYDSIRHYNFWMNHIQGKENQVFDDVFIEKLTLKLKTIQPNRKLIKYDQLRKILKNPSIKGTVYNDHVSLLLKIVTGNQCPSLNYDENVITNFTFLRIMSLYADLKLPNKNKPYYPYFIYKILETQLWDSPKLLILTFIHLQSYNTTVNHDRIFKRICDISLDSDNLKYKATNHADNEIQINKNLRSVE
jgi:hypothetical protein